MVRRVLYWGARRECTGDQEGMVLGGQEGMVLWCQEGTEVIS